MKKEPPKIPSKQANNEIDNLKESQKKKLKNVKLATKENPTVVVAESVSRPLLPEMLKDSFREKSVRQDKGKQVDLTKRTSRGTDFYRLNVIFNKSLTVADVKLAIYLHEILSIRYDNDNLKGIVCVVRLMASTMDLARTYGELGGIYIRDKYHSKTPIFYNEENDFCHLISNAINLVGSDNPTVLNKTLQRLHDYGYITVTDITPENQAIAIPSKTKKSGANRRVRLKHIRLCHWMVYNKVFWQLKGM